MDSLQKELRTTIDGVWNILGHLRTARDDEFHIISIDDAHTLLFVARPAEYTDVLTYGQSLFHHNHNAVPFIKLTDSAGNDDSRRVDLSYHGQSFLSFSHIDIPFVLGMARSFDFPKDKEKLTKSLRQAAEMMMKYYGGSDMQYQDLVDFVSGDQQAQVPDASHQLGRPRRDP